MATPTIQIDQPTPGAGTPGESRDDLILSELVTCSDPANGGGDSYVWEIVDVPVGSAVLEGVVSIATTMTFTPDITGTYLIRLTVNGTDTATIFGAILTANKSIRIPAAGETNEAGVDGWHVARDAMLRQWDNEISGNLQAAYDGTGGPGTGSGRAVIVDDGAITFTNTANNTDSILEITKNPGIAQAGHGLSITMGSNATGHGLNVSQGGSGAAINVATGQIRVHDGTEALPSYAFTSDIDTGARISGPADMRFVAGGSDQVGITNGQMVMHSLGNAGAPAIAPVGGLNTGVYFPAVNQAAVATAGSVAMTWDASQNTLMPIGAQLIFDSDDTYLSADIDARLVGFVDGGQFTQITPTNWVSFKNFQPSATNTLDLGVAGTVWRDFHFGRQTFAPDGSITDPAYTFTNNTNPLGIYRPGVDRMGITTHNTTAGELVQQWGDYTTSVTPPVGGPFTLRIANELFVHKVDAAGTYNESAFLYMHVDTANQGTVGLTPGNAEAAQIHGIYIEVDKQSSPLVDGTAIKVMHYGVDDAVYCAVYNATGVGYEAAAFSDGARGFISTKQTAANTNLNFVPYVALWRDEFAADVDNIGLPNFGQYFAQQSPGRAFVNHRNTTLVETSPVFLITDNDYAWNRWEVLNDGTLNVFAERATSGTTVQDSPHIQVVGSYWNGASAQTLTGWMRHNMLTTGPTSQLEFGISGSLVLSMDTATLNPQGQAFTNVGNVTMNATTTLSGLQNITLQAGAGGTVDLQTGSIVNVSGITATAATPLDIDLQGGDLLAIGETFYDAGASDPSIQGGTADPSAAAGVAANEGSLYLRYVTADGQVWLKTGTAATGWTQLSTGGTTLQAAYDGGSTIVSDDTNPVLITKTSATGGTATLLEVSATAGSTSTMVHFDCQVSGTTALFIETDGNGDALWVRKNGGAASGSVARFETVNGTTAQYIIEVENGEDSSTPIYINDTPVVAANAHPSIQIVKTTTATGPAIQVDEVGQGVVLDMPAASSVRGHLAFDGATGDPSTTTEGDFWYNSTANVFKYYDGSTVQTLSTGGGGGNTLDGAYDQGGAGAGRAITADTGAVTITNNAADNNNVLELTKSPAGAQSGHGLSITMGATTTGDGISVANSGSGAAIRATSGNIHAPIFRASSGVSAASPAYSFESATNYGFYLSGGTTLTLAANGGGALTATTSLVSSLKTFRVPDGTENVPSVGGNSHNNAGLWWPGGGALAVSTGSGTGTEAVRWNASQQTVLSATGSDATPELVFDGFLDTGIRMGTNDLRIVRGGDLRIRIHSTDTSIQGDIGSANSTAVAISNFSALTAASGTQTIANVVGTINQSATAGYTMLSIAATETTTGSGDNNLVDASVGGASVFIVQNDGSASFGHANQPGAGVDIVYSAHPQLRLAHSSANLTNKLAYLTRRHYDNTEEDSLLFQGTTGASTATLLLGGGSSLFNTVTQISMYTAANSTTLTGTEIWRSTLTEHESFVPIHAPDGSAANPAYTWSSDNTLGWYYGGANAMSASVAGSLRGTWNTGGLRLQIAGSAATPSVRLNSSNSGIYASATNEVAVSTAGLVATHWDANQNMELAAGIIFNERAAVPHTVAAAEGVLWVRNDTPNVLIFTDDAGTDTVLGAGGGGSLQAAYDGGSTITLSAGLTEIDINAASVGNDSTDTAIGLELRTTTAASTGNQQYSPMWVQEGQGWKTAVTAASQSVRFATQVIPVQDVSAPTGIWQLTSSINAGAWSTHLEITSGSQIQAATGTAGAPTYSFTSTGSEDAGMYRSGTSQVGIAAGGENVATFDNAGITLTQQNQSSGSPSALILTGGIHTNGLTASTEVVDVRIDLSRTVGRATGAVATQRAVFIDAPTYQFAGASTITDAATVYIESAPVAGTNATITNAYALWVDAGDVRFDDQMLGPSGAVATPTYTFQGNSNYGMFFESGTSSTSFAANGTIGLRVQSSLVQVTQGILRINDDTGDSVLQIQQGGSTYYSMGLDQSTPNNDFVLAEGASVGTNNVFAYNRSTDTFLYTLIAHDITQAAASSGTPTLSTVTSGAHTSLTNAEYTTIDWDLSASVQFDGVADSSATTFANQRAFTISAPTYTSQATSVDTETYPNTTIIDHAATMYIDGPPIPSTRALLKERHALWIDVGNSSGSDFLMNGILVDNSLATTLSDTAGVIIRNSDDATASVSRDSLGLIFQSQGWNNTTAQSEWVAGGIWLEAVEEASNEPTAQIRFGFDVGSSITDPWSALPNYATSVARINSAGDMYLDGAVIPSGAFQGHVETLTDAATIATDCSLGNVFTVTLTANRTLGAPTNAVAGTMYTWIIVQDGTGSHTLAYNAVFDFPGGTAPTLTTGKANAIDLLTAVYDGTQFLCTFEADFS